MNTTGWSRGLEVTADGQGVVSHAGLVLLRALADKTGLTGGLSRALATPRLLVHDRGRVLADLAAAIADGAEVISDFAVVRHQEQLFGPVASVPTAWRMLSEVAAGGPRAQARITRAVNAARRRAWAGIEARHGAIPGVRVADRVLAGVICIRLDATVTPELEAEGWAKDRRRTRTRKGRSRISRGSVIIRCWRTAITPPRDWPGCSARAAPGPVPSPITCRSSTRRSSRSRRGTGAA